jgi:hypothetical protein
MAAAIVVKRVDLEQISKVLAAGPRKCPESGDRACVTMP